MCLYVCSATRSQNFTFMFIFKRKYVYNYVFWIFIKTARSGLVVRRVSGHSFGRQRFCYMCTWYSTFLFICIFTGICISKATQGSHFRFLNLPLSNREDMFMPWRWGGGRENLSSAFAFAIKPINACLNTLIVSWVLYMPWLKCGLKFISLFG